MRIYGSLACYGAAAAALFVRHQAVRIVGTTVLSCGVADGGCRALHVRLHWNEIHQHEETLIIDHVMKHRPLRTRSIYMNNLQQVLDLKRIAGFLILGSTFAAAARASHSRFRRVVTVDQIAPYWASFLVTGLLFGEVAAHQVKMKSEKYRYNAVFAVGLMTFLALNVGILIYRIRQG